MATRNGFRRDADQGQSNPSSHQPMPGSPTLTNPDMILPDYEDADYLDDDRSQSPILQWKHTSANDMRFHMPLQSGYAPGPISPTTPIIYGNGTMLSDIGEVTEVESNAGGNARRTSSRYSDYQDDAPGLQPALAVIPGNAQRPAHITSRERRASMDSTSTITIQDQHTAFADFDDGVSVDDSNFQGDDEESMASSYVEEMAAQRVTVGKQPVRRIGEETQAANAISKRAELILANAKKRLTTMEGNLTRARSSLSQSSMSNGSTPSPPMTRPRTSARQPNSQQSPNHVRMKSDHDIEAIAKPNAGLQRSASALGAAGGYRQPSSSSSSKSGDATPAGPNRLPHAISNYPLDTLLEPLSEDDSVSFVDGHRDSVQYATLLTPTTATFAEKDMTRSASAAQMRDIHDQMQGLKGKISTLKEQARADSLKRRSLQSLRTPSPFTHARWDQGYSEPRDVQKGGDDDVSPHCEEVNGPLATDFEAKANAENPDSHSLPEGQPKTSDNSEGSADDGLVYSPQPDHDPSALHKEVPLPTLTQQGHDELHIEAADAENVPEERLEPAFGLEQSGEAPDQEQAPQKSNYDEDGTVVEEVQDQSVGEPDDEASESGESLYHETYQNPLSHEDREDAFDYEHFFLHSAMGSLSRHRASQRNRSGSVSSEDSVETTRGPALNRPRRSSAETISSMDSFATATEGRNSRSSAAQADEHDDFEEDAYTDHFSPKHASFGDYGTLTRDGNAQRHYHNAFINRSASTTASRPHPYPRPSVSSLESTGTTRSFPLISKARLNGDVPTPGASPDHQGKEGSASVGFTGPMDDTAAALTQSGAIQMLGKEDQAAVQQLVASLGRCILRLSEGSRANTEGREYRRRLDAARRALEGMDEP